MKILILPGLLALTLTFTGCQYRGAVYSEYNQTALDIRAQQASSSPIKVNFGYDRGVFAYVPKRNASTNSFDGEAVSVIAWNNLQHDINPFTTATNSLLRVDAGFISGVAAIVATAPADAEVVIVPVHDAVFESLVANESGTPRSKWDKGNTYRIQTSGSPGMRVKAATQALNFPTEGNFGADIATTKLEQWLALDEAQTVKTNSDKLDKWMTKHHLNPDHRALLLYEDEAKKTRRMAARDLINP